MDEADTVLVDLRAKYPDYHISKKNDNEITIMLNRYKIYNNRDFLDGVFKGSPKLIAGLLRELKINEEKRDDFAQSYLWQKIKEKDNPIIYETIGHYYVYDYAIRDDIINKFRALKLHIANYPNDLLCPISFEPLINKVVQVNISNNKYNYYSKEAWDLYGKMIDPLTRIKIKADDITIINGHQFMAKYFDKRYQELDRCSHFELLIMRNLSCIETLIICFIVNIYIEMKISKCSPKKAYHYMVLYSDCSLWEYMMRNTIFPDNIELPDDDNQLDNPIVQQICKYHPHLIHILGKFNISCSDAEYNDLILLHNDITICEYPSDLELKILKILRPAPEIADLKFTNGQSVIEFLVENDEYELAKKYSTPHRDYCNIFFIVSSS